MNLCCANCLEITNNSGKITMYYDDGFKKNKIKHTVMNVDTTNVKILIEKI